jgi:hypothetical protein
MIRMTVGSRWLALMASSWPSKEKSAARYNCGFVWGFCSIAFTPPVWIFVIGSHQDAKASPANRLSVLELSYVRYRTSALLRKE